MVRLLYKLRNILKLKIKKVAFFAIIGRNAVLYAVLYLNLNVMYCISPNIYKSISSKQSNNQKRGISRGGRITTEGAKTNFRLALGINIDLLYHVRS